MNEIPESRKNKQKRTDYYQTIFEIVKENEHLNLWKIP